MRALITGAMFAALALAGAGRHDAAAASPATAAASAVAAARGDAFGPAFLENAGRLPCAVDFTLDTADRTFFFGRGGVTISVRDPARPERGRWVMTLVPEGAREVRPAADDARDGVTNLLMGPKEDWRVGLRSFRRLVYRDLWPGIDLVWRAEPGRLKWECDVHPGADPSAIRFTLRGAEDLAIGEDGALTASTPLGDFVDSAPVAWQTSGGRETKVEAAFRLDPAAGRISFDLGPYDPAAELVIDPATVLRAAYIGGGQDDAATAVAVDALRNVYIAGVTRSPESTFPAGTGPDVSFNGGGDDAFVLKIDATFRAVWSGYIGGAGSDGATSIVVDGLGSAYVGGATLSANFPVVGPLGAVRGGGYDAFVAKVAPTGRSLTWSSVFGGVGEDRALALAIDGPGRVLAAGRSAGGMPWGTGFGGGLSDGFVMGIRADGSVLDWGRYVGGNQSDTATGVAIDVAGNVYVCGNTTSGEGTFPVRLGPDSSHNGAQDAFVVQLEPLNRTVTYGGYVGGAGTDDAVRVEVDSLGRAYVAGSTTSDEGTFPAVVGPHLVHHGKSDAYVARVAADGASLEYCGFVGGSGDDFAFGLALDANRRAYVVGTTGSAPTGYPGARSKFPVVDGPDLTFNGGIHDGWLGVVQPDGSQMASLGYVGGKGNTDDVTAVAILPGGDVVVVGDTVSAPKTFPAGTGPALAAGGARDAFVAQIQYAAPSPVLLVPQLDAAAPSGFDVAVDWTDVDPNETGFEIQRTAPDGAATVFTVASPAGVSGPLHFADTTAFPGARYAYRIRGFDAKGKGEFSECVVVATQPSLGLKLKKSTLSGAGLDLAGAADVRFKFSFQAGSATSSIDPVADGITFTVAGAGADQVVSVPPNDPAWTVSGSVLTWTSPVADAARVTVDTAKRTVRLEATGLSLAAPLAHNAVTVTVSTGGSFGASAADWRGSRGSRYRYP